MARIMEAAHHQPLRIRRRRRSSPAGIVGITLSDLRWSAPRSLLKYPCTPRESALGRMARRERRAYPQRSVRSKQRRQTPQSALALRVAPLFGLARVARRLQTTAGMRPPRALARPKIGATRGAWVFQQTPNESPLQEPVKLTVGTCISLSAMHIAVIILHRHA